MHYDPKQGRGAKPVWDRSKGKPPGYKSKSCGGSARVAVDSPRQQSDKQRDRDQRYADKDEIKRQQRVAEFKAKKKGSSGTIKDK